MNITIEDVSALEKRFKIEVPAKRVDEEIDLVIKEFQNFARIEGFRKGKAPLHMIEKKYTKEIDDEVKRVLIPKVVREVIEERKLKLASTPRIEDLQFQRGVSMSFSTMMELEPEVPLPEYKGIKIPKLSAELTAEEKQKALERLLEQYAEFEDQPDKTLVENDYAVVTFESKYDGKPLKETKDLGQLCGGKSLWVWIKPDIIVRGFTDHLVGAKIGDTRKFTLTLPEEEYFEELQGKDIDFEVSIENIKLKKMPELNDEFFQKNFAASREILEKNIEDTLSRQKANDVHNLKLSEIFKFLANSANFELPASHVERETQQLINSVVAENQRRGISDEMIKEKQDEIFSVAETNAKDRVKVSFLLGRIAEKENIQITDQDLTLELMRLSYRVNMPPKKLMKRIRENGLLESIKADALDQKTLKLLLEWAIEE